MLPIVSNGVAFKLGEWEVDPTSGIIRSKSKTRQLSPLPLAILEYLAERPNEVISVEELADAAWNRSFVTTEAVYRQISRLRKALAHGQESGELIATVQRRGYRLTIEPEPIVNDEHTATRRGLPLTIEVQRLRCTSNKPDSVALALAINDHLIRTLTDRTTLEVHTRDGAPADVTLLYSLRGTCNLQDDAVSLTIQLTNVPESRIAWSHSASYPKAALLSPKGNPLFGLGRRIESMLVVDMQAKHASTENEAARHHFRLGYKDFVDMLLGAKNNPSFRVHCFEQAIALDPDFLEAHQHLAMCYIRRDVSSAHQQAKQKALDCLNAAQRISPQASHTAFLFGQMHRELDLNYPAVERHLQQALELGMPATFVEIQLGALNLQRGNWREALVNWDLALSIGGLHDRFEALAGTAWALLGLGRTADALEASQEALATASGTGVNVARICCLNSLCLTLSGESGRARQQAERIVTEYDMAAADWAAWPLAYSGEVDAARVILEDGSAPSNAEPVIEAAPRMAAYCALGDLNTAIAWLRFAFAENQVHAFLLARMPFIRDVLQEHPHYSSLMGEIAALEAGA